MPTPSGVEYNLDISPYMCEWRGLEFFFSSAIHRKKFQDKIEIRIDWLNDSLSKRFKFEVEADYIAVMQLYCQVETRGFLVHDVKERRWYQCRENIKLNGMILSGKN